MTIRVHFFVLDFDSRNLWNLQGDTKQDEISAALASMNSSENIKHQTGDVGDLGVGSREQTTIAAQTTTQIALR